ncbi:hypothetical protein F0562_022322 [Nyssa sinensis]|uniref:Uncharacterized protein n=1 Tax=Nyssa sinensis TaxID=561372 RepID=A0A5J5BQC2_9ASTE|nr:hypothetical protein F0562_022322 [Nyssa sinensis]
MREILEDHPHSKHTLSKPLQRSRIFEFVIVCMGMASPIQIVTPVVVLVIVGVAGLVIKRCFYDDDNDEDRVDCCNKISSTPPKDPCSCTRKPICGGGD